MEAAATTLWNCVICVPWEEYQQLSLSLPPLPSSLSDVRGAHRQCPKRTCYITEQYWTQNDSQDLGDFYIITSGKMLDGISQAARKMLST